MNTEVTAEDAQDLINEIFPGLSMFVRDVSLSADVAAKYTPAIHYLVSCELKRKKKVDNN